MNEVVCSGMKVMKSIFVRSQEGNDPSFFYFSFSYGQLWALRLLLSLRVSM